MFFKDDEQVDAVGSMYVSDVKQHSEASNFPDADVTSLLGHSRGSKPEVGESAVPQGKLAKHAAGVLMKILYCMLRGLRDLTYYGQSTAWPAVSRSGRRRMMLHCSG